MMDWSGKMADMENGIFKRLHGPQPQVAGLCALVIGMGDSGAAAAELLLHEQASVWVYDANPVKAEELRRQWEPRGVPVLSGDLQPMPGFDFCIVSPGVPPFGRFFTWLRQAHIPLLGEMELACRFFQRPIIAVTGTNGKTTVVNMITHILARCGKNPTLAGNVGYPVAQAALETERYSENPLVLEVSSYQCETFQDFKADVAVITNLAPDHLDRYINVHHYFETKFQITINQTAENTLWMGSRVEGDCPDWVSSRKRFFSNTTLDPFGIFYHDGTVCLRDDSKEESLVWPSFEHHLPQYIENALAATGAVSSLGVSVHKALQALESFEPLPHRQEYVGEVGGIRCYNDSKATNVHALEAALRSIPAPILLIAGGRSKGDPLASLIPLLQEKVRGLYLIGEAKDEFASAWGAAVQTHKENTLEEAVAHALSDGQSGDSLLLSPACASWDMFSNYQERGERFKAAVKEFGHD
jgi:UDP-N-acetylmuramoylalanine--D-glutamate ligase